MKTLKNRVLSGAMAGVLAMSLAVPAFAADPTTKVTGSYKAVTISVDVPATGVAFINPYGLDLEVPQDSTDTSNSNKATISGQQIVSAPMAIKNRTAMDLDVNATVTGTVVALTDTSAIPMKLATASTKGSGTEGADDYVAPATGKSAFVYLQAKAAEDTTGAAAAIATEFAGWTASAYNEETDVIVSTRAATKEGIVTLRAADVTDPDNPTYKAGSIALFRLAGDCVAAPSNAWTENDKFEATIAFSFRPAQIDKYAINIDVTDNSNTPPATATADVTTAAEGDTVTINVTGVAAGDTVTYRVLKADGTAFTPAITTTDVVNSGTARSATFVMPAEAVKVTVTVA